MVEAAALFIAGGGMGYWLCRWKEQKLREARAFKEKSLLENARREAESIIREARVTASEESLKVREDNQRLFETRRSDLKTMEKRIRVLLTKPTHDCHDRDIEGVNEWPPGGAIADHLYFLRRPGEAGKVVQDDIEPHAR